MNIGRILKEGSVGNLEWLDETETFNPSNMGLTNEEEMKIQWDKDLKPENKEKIVKRKVNDLLNEGALGKAVISQIKKAFVEENIPKDLNKYIKARNGVVGTVLIDCSVFSDKREYAKVKKASKYKAFNQFAINCKCDHKVVADSEEVNTNNKGNIDGVLNSETKKAKHIKICSKTGLPVLERMADYSSKNATDVLSKLVKLDYITLNEEKDLLANNSALVAVKKAFIKISENSKLIDNSKYDKKIDNSDYVIKKRGMSVAVDKKAKKQKVQGIAEKPLVINKISKAKELIDVNIDNKEASLDTKNTKAVKPVDVKISKKEKKLDFKKEEIQPDKLVEVKNANPKLNVELDKTQKQSNINVDIKRQATDIDIADSIENIDIDNDAFVDGDWFEKGDMNVDIKNNNNVDELDVDGSSEFNF